MIDKDTILNIAASAKLTLTESELKKFSKDLTNILDSFKILDELNVEGIEPSFHPIKTEDRLREDKVGKCLTNEQVMNLIKINKENGQFRVPKIM